MTTDIAIGFNQRIAPDQTICVAVDLLAAFDTAPPATAQCYLSGRQDKICFRGVKSTSRKVNTGVPEGSKLSPSLFSFYITDMPRLNEPVKWVFYADVLTVWDRGVKIPDLEDRINSYLEEITTYLKDNSLLISAPKYLVTLFSPDPSENTN